MGKNENPKKLSVQTDKLSKVGGGLSVNSDVGTGLKSNVGDSANCRNDYKSNNCNNESQGCNNASQGKNGGCATMSLNVDSISKLP